MNHDFIWSRKGDLGIVQRTVKTKHRFSKSAWKYKKWTRGGEKKAELVWMIVNSRRLWFGGEMEVICYNFFNL